MSNRKRVTLTFEIDDSDGYNDEAFMRHDFLQELSCCVNDPYEDTFVMKVEDADVPHEMTAIEYERILQRFTEWCASKLCTECSFFDDCPQTSPDVLRELTPEQYVAAMQKWDREHPEEKQQ